MRPVPVGLAYQSGIKNSPSYSVSDPMTSFELKMMFKVTWEGMRKNHFQHMHSKVEEPNPESRLVEYKKRIGITREMNSLLNKQPSEMQENPYSKRTRS